KGTPPAMGAAWLGLVGRGIGEPNPPGGKVSISADGANIQRAGSKIAVDGGYVDYQAGQLNTSQLQLGNKLVDIGSALPGVLYSAVVNLPASAAQFEAGYRQGSSAGTVQFSAPILVLQGSLSGQSQAGARQRDISAAGFAQGGQLQIGNVSGATLNPVSGRANLGASDQFGFMGKLEIGGHATQTAQAPAVGAAFDTGNAAQRLLSSQLDLDTVSPAHAGFSRLSAVTMGNVEVAAPVVLAPGGRLWLGSSASSQGTLAIPGGTINLNAPVTIPGGAVALAAAGTLQVSEAVTVDLAGRWTNDRSIAAPALDAAGLPTGALVLKGGTLGLWANQLLVGQGFGADVSAGAWMNTRAALRLGSAGAIVLQAVPQSLDSAPEKGLLRLGDGAALAGYGFAAGGKLSLTGRNVALGAPAPGGAADDLALAGAFFQQGGFSQYNIAANVNLSVLPGSLIAPRALSWVLDGAAGNAASGLMTAAAAPALLDLAGPSRVRAATSLSLQAPAQKLANAGRLLVDTGAQLLLDPGASLTLLAGRQLTLLGQVDAPAGTILLGLTADASAPYFTERSLWFGPGARVQANGSTARLYTDGLGLGSGELLAGGSIRVGNLQNGVLGPAPGYVVAEAGALFSVNGVGMNDLSFRSGNGITPARAVGSAGGSIEIRAREGLLFAGALAGGPGGAGSSAGSLTVAPEGQTQIEANPSLLTVAVKA
ncbi:MAG: hypothetical protein H7242_19300, partial [Microbacteriaceae bacterium]|nr:hypothetical protein [Burkholderiaceae bacterium]